MPSPSSEHPGLFIRDPYRYSDAMLVIPPVLIECLRFFDGKQTALDLRQRLFQLTGEFDLGGVDQNLIETLATGLPGRPDLHRDAVERRREFALQARYANRLTRFGIRGSRGNGGVIGTDSWKAPSRSRTAICRDRCCTT